MIMILYSIIINILSYLGEGAADQIFKNPSVSALAISDPDKLNQHWVIFVLCSLKDSYQ